MSTCEGVLFYLGWFVRDCMRKVQEWNGGMELQEDLGDILVCWLKACIGKQMHDDKMLMMFGSGWGRYWVFATVTPIFENLRTKSIGGLCVVCFAGGSKMETKETGSIECFALAFCFLFDVVWWEV